MANISHGMNVQEVQQLVQKLHQCSGQIEDIVNMLNAKVEGTSWVGPDASAFKGQWWPQHRQVLMQIKGDLFDFGTLANKNIEQQVSASGQ